MIVNLKNLNPLFNLPTSINLFHWDKTPFQIITTQSKKNYGTQNHLQVQKKSAGKYLVSWQPRSLSHVRSNE